MDQSIPQHFDGTRFFNPDAPQVRGLLDLLRWKRTSRAERSPRFIADVTPSKPPVRVGAEEIRVTMINHSTLLIQQAGWNILTDPIWSERASPLKAFGPRRHRAPGVRLEDLPPIDTVLLSHNHYDHLDPATLRALLGRHRPHFVVPIGLGQWLRSRNMVPVHELDWGESWRDRGTVIHSVPALHFSGRGLFDRNQTLWCGYVIEAARRISYFAGDTGFGNHFAWIRERFGPPSVAFLPIGAYEPRWFMSPVHMAPDEAARAHQILGARTSIAIHHGTFQLADESIDAPKKRLRECAAADSFLVLENGQSVTLA
ncbi:MAG: hydrolase [Terriglobia bacterium]|nr:MAG: hydrolase [Terriglobia bacterium]